MNLSIPSVGKWYKELQQGTIFEVVSVDDLEQTIETQLIDGEVSDYDFDSWNQLLFEEIEEPENWSNAYEMNDEDFLDSDAAIHPDEWNSPINLIETDIVNGIFDDL